MNRFDQLAREWDVNPVFLERTRAVAARMRERIPLTGLSALEAGAGTGLLSFALAEDLSRVVACDPSPGMVEVLSGKIDRCGLSHLEARRAGDALEGIEGPFDLVFLQMALHHFPSPEAFLRRARQILSPEGWIAIADLDREDGSFHGPEITDVHPGFERATLVEWLEKAGFEPLSIETVFEMEHASNGTPGPYPVFLATARRKE